MSNDTNIDEILSRSVAEILPSKESLKELLSKGGRIRIYIGADATGPQLHLGHATNFILLEKLRKLGHEIIVLFGDFTAMIGDPTDRDSERKPLTVDQVNEHIRTWKDQVGKILSFDDPDNPASIVKNSEWLSKLTFAEILGIASSFTVQHMLERDMFERRMNAGKAVHLHEFLYPLMQGYDSVALDVDVEVGGTDQTFNMLVGRILQKKYNNKEKFVIATSLLENPATGKKLMSKSEGKYIAMNDTAADMYGKTMALPDETIVQMFTDCTYVPMNKVREIQDGLKKETVHPKDAKMRLAREIVTIYHGAGEATKAQERFTHTFGEGGIPSDIQEAQVTKGMALGDVLIQAGVVASKTEFRRLIEDGAVTLPEKGTEKISNLNTLIETDMVVKVGKRRFLKILVT